MSIKSEDSKSDKSSAPQTQPSPFSLEDNKVHDLKTGLKGAALDNIPAYLVPEYVEESILVGDIRQFVRLPKYIHRDEWISSHGKQFPKQMIYYSCYVCSL